MVGVVPGIRGVRPKRRWGSLHFAIGVCFGIVLYRTSYTHLRPLQEGGMTVVSNSTTSEVMDAGRGTRSAVLLGKDVISDWLTKRIRILCWVHTCPPHLENITVHVRNTWATRCDKTLYMSSEETDFPTIAIIDHVEGREYLWPKSRGAHQYVYNNYIDEFDWFLKADDDTYVIMENMRRLLSKYDPEEAIFFGHRFRHHVPPQGFMSGGAGYVHSRGALRALVEQAFPDPELCPPITTIEAWEDVKIGSCFQNIGIKPGDSRDGDFETFHAFSPPIILQPDAFPLGHRYAEHSYYPLKRGLECCSNHSISFHYVDADSMKLLEYMIYHMRPFGEGYHTCPSDMESIIEKQAMLDHRYRDNA